MVSGLLLAWIIINIAQIVLIFKNALSIRTWLDAVKKPPVIDFLLAVATLIVFFRVFFEILSDVFGEELILRYGSYFDRLLPVMNLAMFVAFETVILILFFTLRSGEELKKPSRAFFIRLIIVLALLGLATAIVSYTGLGIVPGYQGDWSRGLPAVPLLEWQIALACLFCLGMAFFEARTKLSKFPRLDVWICLAIWFGAALFWLGQPVIPNASALEPHEPNFEIYPFLDAQTYDEFAQSVLIGNGFGKDAIPQRPLYIVFLVSMHVIAGQNYSGIIVLQTLFFATFPVLLYLFGKEFFGRPIGISIALLAILRDYTSNIVSPFTGNISYSKLYLAEIPTAICLILFLLVAMRWIKAGFPAFWGFLLGGILGVGMLIRTQVVVALPVVLLFALLVQSKKLVSLTRSVLLMFLTIVLVISPWLWRNWNITGEIIFDNPASQTANLALRYSRLNGNRVDILPQPGESTMAYNDRLMEIASDAISSNPIGAAKGVLNFFLNHGVNNVLLFPLRNELKDFKELLTPTYAFWERWEGTPNPTQGLLLAFYIFLFGLGVATAWYRNGWLGLMPLLVNLLYNLWTSLALLSGQRFMLTMDWSIYLYYMIGLFALLSGFLFVLNDGRATILKWYESNTLSMAQPPVGIKLQSYIIVGILFFGIGLSLAVTEMAFPVKYPVLSQENVLKNLLISPALERSGFNAACLQNTVIENHLTFSQGRALYPRYYHPGDGENFTDSVGYKKSDEGRMVFEMVGQFDGRIIFPMYRQPEFFPNASDITLIRDDNGITWFIFVENGGIEELYISESVDVSDCK
jgi:4-amino-4-deoxy-L-arabinose transferase-like glycosyltransferase